MRLASIDVGALYAKALGRLDDVGRYLDELRQLRASAAPDDGEDLASGAACPAEDEEPGDDGGNGDGEARDEAEDGD